MLAVAAQVAPPRWLMRLALKALTGQFDPCRRWQKGFWPCAFLHADSQAAILQTTRC